MVIKVSITTITQTGIPTQQMQVIIPDYIKARCELVNTYDALGWWCNSNLATSWPIGTNFGFDVTGWSIGNSTVSFKILNSTPGVVNGVYALQLTAVT